MKSAIVIVNRESAVLLPIADSRLPLSNHRSYRNNNDGNKYVKRKYYNG